MFSCSRAVFSGFFLSSSHYLDGSNKQKSVCTDLPSRNTQVKVFYSLRKKTALCIQKQPFGASCYENSIIKNNPEAVVLTQVCLVCCFLYVYDINTIHDNKIIRVKKDSFFGNKLYSFVSLGCICKCIFSLFLVNWKNNLQNVSNENNYYCSATSADHPTALRLNKTIKHEKMGYINHDFCL